MARGNRDKPRLCRAGCNAPESLDHVTQVCHRTHGQRIARHGALVNYITMKLKQSGYATTVEPRFDCGLVPDIVAVRDNCALVIDPQICGASINADVAHSMKVAKYSGDDFVREIKETYHVSYVSTFGIIVNNRGVWSNKSAKIALEYGVISKSDLRVISSRVLLGTFACFTKFSRMTACVSHRGMWGRSGVG